MLLSAHQLLVRHFLPDITLADTRVAGNGLINETFVVTASGPSADQYILQRINTALFGDVEALMANFAALAAHLQGCADYSLRTPAPMRALSGRYWGPDGSGGYWRMFPFFTHTFAPEQRPDAAQAYQAARAFGQFAAALSDFPATALYQPLPGFHDTLKRYGQLEEVVKQDPAGRRDSVVNELEALRAARRYAEKIQELALPVRVTHNDTKAGNVLLDIRTGQAVAVIDWDTVMPGSLLSDYGDMVRTFVPDVYEDAPAAMLQLRHDVWEALDAGFLEATAGILTETECKYLRLGALWIVSEQALRFLTDYIAGDVYYKTNRPDHNLDRARNQLALLAALESSIDLTI